MKNEYIVIDKDNTVSKCNINEKELLNLVDNEYIILRINNGKIEQADTIHPWKKIDNVVQVVTEIIWKEPELKKSSY